MEKGNKKLLSNADLAQIKHWIKIVKRDEEASKKIEEFISAFSYKYIDKGKSRMVFEINKDFVIKVPTKARGLEHINREIDIYQSSIPIIKEHLGKIVIHGDGWLIMERLNKEIKESREHKKQLSILKKKFVEEGITPHDTKMENLRRGNNGEIIFIDYGHFKKRS